MALNKPQDKFSDSAVIMQFEIIRSFEEETLCSFFGVHFGGDFRYKWINEKVTTLFFPRGLNLKVSLYCNSP